MNHEINIRASHYIVFLFFFLLLTEASQFRNRREAVDYVIDTLVVVDDHVLDKWVSYEPASQSLQQRQTEATTKLKAYVSLVIHQANDRLKTLDNQGEGWSVQMSIARILVNTNPLDTVDRIGNTNQIDPIEALDAIREWAVAEKYHTSFDHILLLSGESFDSSSETALNNLMIGRAYIGRMCNTDGYSVSFVQEIGGFQNTGIIAHEIAHSLDSAHDGEGTSSDCSSSDRYVMAVAWGGGVTTSSNKEHPWYFSACSSRSIGKFLASPEASCLRTNQEPVAEFVDSQDIVAGLQYDGNEQCRNIYGTDDSRLCLGEDFGTLEEICTAMKCLDTSESTSARAFCGIHQAAEGTPCANGKLCVRGKCISDDRAPVTVVSSICPFGDSVKPINGMSCAEFISSQPDRCYDDNVRSLCCTSCESVKSESEVCPYGDRYTGCLVEFCHSIRPDGTRYDLDCCGTCDYQTALDCLDVPSVEGMSCAQYIQRGGVQRCYDASVAFHCCKSCAERRNGPVGCEYGDRFLGNVCPSTISSRDNCTEEKGPCCHTCLGYMNLNSSPSFIGGLSCLCSSLLFGLIISWLDYI